MSLRCRPDLSSTNTGNITSAVVFDHRPALARSPTGLSTTDSNVLLVCRAWTSVPPTATSGSLSRLSTLDPALRLALHRPLRPPTAMSLRCRPASGTHLQQTIGSLSSSTSTSIGSLSTTPPPPGPLSSTTSSHRCPCRSATGFAVHRAWCKTQQQPSPRLSTSNPRASVSSLVDLGQLDRQSRRAMIGQQRGFRHWAGGSTYGLGHRHG